MIRKESENLESYQKTLIKEKPKKAIKSIKDSNNPSKNLDVNFKERIYFFYKNVSIIKRLIKSNLIIKTSIFR